MYTAFMPVCLNCAVYSWKPVKVPNPFGSNYIKEESDKPLLRCSKCKMAHYCGLDCQREHWVKVHKEKCKYARGGNAQLAGVHRHKSSLCTACGEEEEKGTAKKKDDPAWGCHLQGDMKEFWSNPVATFRGRDGELYDGPLAVELGELTGKFTSQVDHVVSFLQRILYKMEVSKHPLSKRDDFEELSHELFCLRHDLLMATRTIPAGPLVQHFHSTNMMNKGIQKKILGIIRKLCTGYEDNLEDKYRMWDTFILVFDYFLDSLKKMKKDFEDLEGRATDPKVAEMLIKVETSASVQKKWETAVAMLDKGLPAYKDLLELVLGKLSQKCSSCKAAITVEATFGDHPSGSRRESRPVAICQGFLLQFHCGKKKCREAVVSKHGAGQMKLIMLITSTLQAHKGFNCAWCSKLHKKVHRCNTCKTKVYCSKACLDMDWKAVHSKICSANPDPRKVKEKHRA